VKNLFPHPKAQSTGKFDPGEFFGIWKESGIDADKVAHQMRDEWERTV
jgi:hypothetical protein